MTILSDSRIKEIVKLTIQSITNIKATQPIAIYAAIKQACIEQDKLTREGIVELNKKLGYELDGVIIDTEERGFDDVCLDTVKRVRNQLANQLKSDLT